MQEIFSLFNIISSFLYALLILAGITSWSFVGICRFLEIIKTMKGKNDSVVE